tara:strand:+ start:672 stop:1811 length:1140 start_codon:yes stop_codon:yes gene_type:complete
MRYLSAAKVLLFGATLLATLAARAELPRAMAWTAYNLGTTGYNQSVAIGKMLKDTRRVTLRVIPGKNDVSRLLPLVRGRVQFTANGVATYFAQEGVFQFAAPKWGPVPLRLVMMSNGLTNQAVAVTAESGMTSLAELRGKRIPWVRGAPAVNVSMEALLACHGITWNDVKRVDFPGYNAMWNGIVDGQIDAAYATTVSGPTRKLEASPRGIAWPAMPHSDNGCWARVHAIAPYFAQHVAVRGTGISDAAPHEGGTYPYPLLTTLATTDKALVGALARAIDEGYPRFRDADPGAIGWARDRQLFDWVVPWHAGAVDYFRSVGAWTDAHDAHNKRLIARQAVLADVWERVADQQSADDFEARWMAVRAEKLTAAGFDPVWR